MASQAANIRMDSNVYEKYYFNSPRTLDLRRQEQESLVDREVQIVQRLKQNLINVLWGKSNLIYICEGVLNNAIWKQPVKFGNSL